VPKKAYKIEDFSGGINQLADPRDIGDNQFEELFNADVSRVGKITLPGNALNVHQVTNIKNNVVSPDNSDGFNILNTNQGIAPGYGLFAFSHDFNMRGITGSESGDTNKEQTTDFLCINDGAHINIWDSCHLSDLGIPFWLSRVIKLGEAHAVGDPSDVQFSEKVKPVYYMAGNGLRVCDGQFCALDTNVNTQGSEISATNETITAASSLILKKDEYIQINNEIMKVTADNSDTTIPVKRGQFGTTATSHTDSSIFRINVPKVLTHINRPMLEKAGANVNINRWVEDIQAPEKPDPGDLTIIPDGKLLYNNGTNLITGAEALLPSGPETVHLGLFEAADGDDIFSFNDSVVPSSETSAGEAMVVITTNTADIAGAGFALGKSVIITGCTGDGAVLNGVHEIVGLGTGGVFKIASELPVSLSTTDYDEAEIQLEQEVISDDLKNQYILGMSYLYQGGGNEIQESDVTTAHVLTKYISESESVFRTISNWKVADGNGSDKIDTSDTQAFSTSAHDTWQLIDGVAKTTSGNNDWLYYVGSTTLDTSSATEYYVSITVDSITSGTLEVYLAPDNDFTNSSKLTITDANGAGTYVKKLSTQTNGTAANIVGIRASDTVTAKISNVQVWSTTGAEMTTTNAMDFRTYLHAIKGQFGFLCNNSRSGSTQNNSWNERIEGFKIYMKQVDMIGGGLAEDFLLLYDVNLKDGTYVCHGKDGDKETLRLGDISGNVWASTHDSGDSATVIDQKSIVTSNLAGDSIKSIPLLSYESENGYPAGTNLAAMYKTSTIVQRKVYIGNLKINNRTFPDRMMRADADKFDTFPDDGTHFIDVATADGDSIVKLESFGDKLIQYKEKTSFLIKVTSEGEDLLETWQGAGVLSPSQVVKTNKGVVWANSNGLYVYDGEGLKQVSEDRFKSDEWSINENKETPVILGYDENSNKVIIQTLNNTSTDSGGFIYDLSTGAIIQCQKLFKWYVSEGSDLDTDNEVYKVAPPVSVTNGEGPTR